MNIPTRNIALVSLLVAMSIVLSRLASIRIAIGGAEGIRIGFGKLPIILGSFILGPLYGGLVGAISDFLGYLIQPIGAYLPHFTIISALCGILPVIIFRIMRGNEENIISFFISVGLTIAVTELFLITYTLHIIFGIPLNILLVPRLISVPITIVIYSYFIHAFVRRKIVQIAHHKE